MLHGLVMCEFHCRIRRHSMAPNPSASSPKINTIVGLVDGNSPGCGPVKYSCGVGDISADSLAGVDSGCGAGVGSGVGADAVLGVGMFGVLLMTMPRSGSIVGSPGMVGGNSSKGFVCVGAGSGIGGRL